jgi:hypothetical protein
MSTLYKSYQQEISNTHMSSICTHVVSNISRVPPPRFLNTSFSFGLEWLLCYPKPPPNISTRCRIRTILCILLSTPACFCIHVFVEYCTHIALWLYCFALMKNCISIFCLEVFLNFIRKIGYWKDVYMRIIHKYRGSIICVT